MELLITKDKLNVVFKDVEADKDLFTANDFILSMIFLNIQASVDSFTVVKCLRELLPNTSATIEVSTEFMEYFIPLVNDMIEQNV